MASQPVLAATGTITFNGTVASTCAITVGSSGTMALSTDLRSLGSHNPGGSAGTATLATTGGVTLSVDSSPGVVHPAGDTTATNWTPTYSSTGGHTIAETSAPTALTGPGLSTVSVHVAGTKTGGDHFVAGPYQVTVVLRCE